MTAPKYPHVEIELSGQDGNAFSMIARTARGLRAALVDADEINEFREEAASGDYDNVLATIAKWVTVV